MSAATPPAAPAPAVDEVPVVDSFAVAAQLRMSATGTRARLSVVLSAETTATPATLVPALRSLGQHVLTDYRLTGHALPEVEVTAVERAETVPATARATGFTVRVTNDMKAKRSSIVVDSELLLGNDARVLLIAATLFAGAEHLLESQDSPIDRHPRLSAGHPGAAARAPRTDLRPAPAPQRVSPRHTLPGLPRHDPAPAPAPATRCGPCDRAGEPVGDHTSGQHSAQRGITATPGGRVVHASQCDQPLSGDGPFCQGGERTSLTCASPPNLGDARQIAEQK